MRVAGVNIGHDVCLALWDDSGELIYEDLSRTFRVKHLSFDVPYTRENDLILQHLHLQCKDQPPDLWAVTVNPHNCEEFDALLGIVDRLVPPAHRISPRSLYQHLLDKGFAEYGCRCILVEHGMAHIASAWFTSGFSPDKGTAAVAIDGWSTVSPDTIMTFSNRLDDVEIKRHVCTMSGNWFDTYLSCMMFGGSSLDAAGKLMGYACHAEPDDAYCEFLSSVILPQLRIAEFRDVYKLEAHLESLVRPTRDAFPELVRESADWERRSDVQRFFASAQKLFTDVLVNTIVSTAMEANAPQVLYAGGCALSVLTNAAIRRQLPSDVSLYIPPFANDLGQAYGASRYAAALRSGCWSPSRSPFNPYIGQLAPDSKLDECAGRYGYKRVQYVPEKVARAIEAGEIVGWAEGKYAAGPRSLGDRSILASACRNGIAIRLNEEVKRREWYRPYAPVLLESVSTELLEERLPSPYMLYEMTPTSTGRSSMSECATPAGGVRAQILPKKWRPKLEELLEAHRTVGGAGVVLNTSLNRGGLPIAGYPEQAFDDCASMGIRMVVFDGCAFVR